MIVSPIAFLLATFLALVRSWFVFKVRMKKRNETSVKIIDFLNNLFSMRNIVESFIIIPFDWKLKSKTTLHIDVLTYLIYASIVIFLIVYPLEL
jgi:hypothetical protein